jgi:hydroxymethylpyrimidine/phosphomethylpyrimidine kinase
MHERADRPLVLCIGGHDPSGGAGITADVEAVRAAGAFAVTLVSALTEQDTCGLVRVLPQAPEHLETQCRTLLSDSTPSVFKIGMLASVQAIEVLAGVIERNPDIPVVLDPVLASGSGHRIADAVLLDRLRLRLIPRSTLVTPNLPEARILTDARTPADCATGLLALGARWVLITGTHDETPDVANWLFNAEGLQQRLDWPRLDGDYHGSGCTLASAIAARLALGMRMREAVAEAQAYTWETLSQAFLTGRCQLTPNRLYALDR